MNLTTEQAYEISELSKDTGTQKLTEFLGLKQDVDYDEKVRWQIHADFLYDTYQHMLSKGVTWSEVAKTVNLAAALLNVTKGQPITDAIEIYRNFLELSELNSRSTAIFTDYFFTTFLQHYKLYQYVFNIERDQTRYVSQYVIHPPIPAQPLKDAKPPLLHDYEKQRRELDEARKPVVSIEQIERKPIKVPVEELNECSQAEEEMTCHNKATTAYSKLNSAITKIIQQVMQEMGGPLIENVKTAISSTYDELETKLDETLLPRPKQLGAPPRYTVPPSIPMPKLSGTTTTSTTVKPSERSSAKSANRKSGRAR